MRITSLRHPLLIAVGGALLLGGMLLSNAAAGTAPSAAPGGDQSDFDQILKADGLTKVGSLLVTTEEADVHAAANRVHGLKTKLASEANARMDVTRALGIANQEWEQIEAQMKALDEREKATKDPAQANALVAPYNELLRQARTKQAQIDQLARREAKVEDYQPVYADAVAAAAGNAKAACERYAALAGDAPLKAALETYNRSAPQPLKLGPSDVFSADAAFLNKCAAEQAVQLVPVRMENGVPIVKVTINGKTQEMVWDSGAVYVSLSSETAAAFGLKATAQDRTVTLTIASGQHTSAKVIVAPEIRVGAFIATDVECVIKPQSDVRPPDLLGGEFQGHFLCRLDQQNGVLHLTPIDKSASVDLHAVLATVAPSAAAVHSPSAMIPRTAPGAGLPPAPAHAPVAVANAQDVFDADGLKKIGFWLETADEPGIHTSANAVRAWKQKVVGEALARANMTRTMDTATHQYDQLEAQLSSLDARLKSLKNDPKQYNQLVDPYNQTLEATKSQWSRIEGLRTEAAKIADSRAIYADAVVTAVRNANGVSDHYVALAADPTVQAAVEKFNAGAPQPSKLGPSSGFTLDLAFLRKCATDMAADGVPVYTDGGTPIVEVTINGKTTGMVWDSGASSVSLSADTAAAFGLHATDQDPLVNAVMANGQSCQCRIILAPEIRVGAFIAKNIECMIWPPSAPHASSLIGGAFQKHFLCRLDQQAGVLHLTPADNSAAAAADARPEPGEPVATVEPPHANPPHGLPSILNHP